jgi:hypothetical protein
MLFSTSVVQRMTQQTGSGYPKGLSQLNLGPGDVAPQELYRRPGSDVSNAKMSKRRLDVDAGVDSNV